MRANEKWQTQGYTHVCDENRISTRKLIIERKSDGNSHFLFSVYVVGAAAYSVVNIPTCNEFLSNKKQIILSLSLNIFLWKFVVLLLYFWNPFSSSTEYGQKQSDKKTFICPILIDSSH